VGSSAQTQDVVAMPLPSRPRLFAFSPRQNRRAAPSCRGGASSMLRLAQPGAARLPQTLDLSQWIRRATQSLLPDDPAWAATEISVR
jgi:hypothetical protein